MSIPSNQTESRALALVTAVGSTIGLLIMGDSLLYLILPLAADELGLALPMVGLLLSINRLVRLASNLWSSAIFERLGPRQPFIIAAIMGAASTALYATGLGVALLLAARMIWGIAWSGLRQAGYQAVWTGLPTHIGKLTGLLWGLVRLGSAISVLLGGVLFDRYGYTTTLTLFTLIALIAIPIALWIRWPAQAPAMSALPRTHRNQASNHWLTSWREALAAPVRRWLAAAGFLQYLLSGIVLSTTSIFLAQRIEGNTEGPTTLWNLGIGVATITGALQGIRWLTDLAIGPALGALSDHIGQGTTAILLSALMFLSLIATVTLPTAPAILFLLLVLLCDGGLHVVMSAAAGHAARSSPQPHRVVGVFTTTSDAGSALGPLLAYLLLTIVGLPTLYLSVSAALCLCLLPVWRAGHA